MGRWTIARVDAVHVATMTLHQGQRDEPLEPTLAAYATTREPMNREFLDVWFSEGGRRSLAEMRDRLLRRS